MDIVSWTFQNDGLDQEKPLYIDCNQPTRSLSYTSTRTLVRKLVSGFNQAGLVKGDSVCVVSFNDIYYTSLFLGIIGAGGCFSGGIPGYTENELTRHIQMTQAKFILTSLKTIDRATAAAENCGIPRSNIFILNFQEEAIPEDYRSWNSLLSHGEMDWVDVEDPDNTIAAYFSTSGTSGFPKAAIVSHSYLVSQGEFQVQISSPGYKVSNLIAIPPFHTFTVPLQHALPLRKGTPTYIMPRFEAQKFANAVEKFGITHTAAVPPILVALYKCAQEKQLKSLRRIYVAGSCATDGMQQQLYTKLDLEARIEQVYGMTEVGWATIWHDREKECTGSIGRPIPGTKLRLVDIDGQIIKEDGVNGEIHIRAPHPMKGYLNDAVATTEAFSDDGWVRSGDVGYFRQGKWYIIDRTKDLIKVRGWQVSPAEIEGSLVEHPDIVDAAVIGVTALDGSGEVPLAFVVRRHDSKLSEEDIKMYLGKRLARYKEVHEVQFVDRIPSNAAGKILRRVLRDTRLAQLASPEESAASAYSNAIKNLQRHQQERNSDGSFETQTDSMASPASSIDTSPIDDVSPSSPLTLNGSNGSSEKIIFDKS